MLGLLWQTEFCIWAVSPNLLGCGTFYSNFLSAYFLLILFSASQDYNAASSEYSSNTNSCGSCRKQGIRHVKLQGIGLAAYFCTTAIAELWKGEVFCEEREAKAKKRTQQKQSYGVLNGKQCAKNRLQWFAVIEPGFIVWTLGHKKVYQVKHLNGCKPKDFMTNLLLRVWK